MKKPYLNQLLSLFLIIIALTFSTCKKDEIETPEGNLIIAKEAIVANANTVTNLVSYDSISLTFNSKATQLSSITPGSILIIEKGEGLLRKVKSQSQEGEYVIVKTENATLEEVIIKGSIESVITLNEENIVSFQFSDDRISLGKGGKFSLIFDKLVVGVNSGITVDGSTKFDPPKVKIRCYFNKGLDSLNASVEINSTTSYKINTETEISGGFKKSPPIATYTFAPVTVLVGVVPVLITPKIQINVGAVASINGKIEAGFEATTNLIAGVKYKNRSINGYSSINHTVANQYINFACKGSIEGYVLLPKVGFYIYSLAGPFVDLKLYGTLKDKTSTTMGLYFGMKAEGGFGTDVPSIFKLPNIELTKSFPILEKEIFSIGSSVKPSVTSSQILEYNSSSASVGGNVTSDGGFTVTERGVYWGTSQNPELTGTKLQIGNGIGPFSTSLSGLSPSTTYYIKAYAINSQGIGYGAQVSFPTLNGSTTGTPIVVFDNYNDIYSCNTAGTNITQLTTGTSIDYNPRINYSKTKIAFYSNRTGRWEIFIMNIDGTSVQQLTTTGVSGGQNNGGIGGMDWTPDGKLLYIKANKIYKMNSDGSGVAEVATAPSNNWAELRCSPTGDKIIAQTQGGWGYTLTMYIMNIDGTNISVFASDLAGVQIIGNFTKNGLSFLYSYDLSGHEESSGQSWNDQIISKRIDGSATTNLSTNKLTGSNDFRPVYITDETKIIFINNIYSASTMRLWIMNADGTNRLQLINNYNVNSVDCK